MGLKKRAAVVKIVACMHSAQDQAVKSYIYLPGVTIYKTNFFVPRHALPFLFSSLI
jgi:hypothetical protein